MTRTKRWRIVAELVALSVFIPVSVMAQDRDFDADGKADILWRHGTNGQVWVWPMNGTAIKSQTYLGSVDVGYQIVGTGDFDADGKADILWRHSANGQVWMWPMNGTTIRSQTYIATVDVGYKIVGIADFDGDGKADILWRQPTNGQVWIWLMNGTSIRSQTYLGSVDIAYQIVATGDFDGDLKADILWRHSANGQVWMWPMNGTTIRSQTYLTTVDLGYKIVGTGDFDADGKADILWRHTTNGQVWIWPMNGTSIRSQTYVTSVDVAYQIVATGDYDGNGKTDILWRHSTNGQLWMWPMNGTSIVSQTNIGFVDVGYQVVNTNPGVTIVAPTVPTISGPGASTGTFQLAVGYAWPIIVSSQDWYELEESTGGSFVKVANTNAGDPHYNPWNVSLTRSSGTYYYRARVHRGWVPDYSQYSAVFQVVVTVPPTVSKTRFVNNTSYPIISLAVDGIQQFYYPNGINVGGYYELELSPGSHSYRIANGFYDGVSKFEMYIWGPTTYTQPSGSTYTVTLQDWTITQLLTRLYASEYWQGDYWDGLVPHTAGFRFYSNGTFRFYVDGIQQGTGSYSLVYRTPASFSVTFTIGSYQGVLYELGGYFTMRNGPPGWELIQYTDQYIR